MGTGMDTSKAYLASCRQSSLRLVRFAPVHFSLSFLLFFFFSHFSSPPIYCCPSMCDKQFSPSPSATAPTVQSTTIHVQTNTNNSSTSPALFFSRALALSPVACAAVVGSEVAACCPRRGWASPCLIQLTIPPHSEQRAAKERQKPARFASVQISIRNSTFPVTIYKN